jgi:hypothetical protein
VPHDRRETSNRFVVQELHKRLKAIEEHFNADGLAVLSPIVYGLDDEVRDGVEDRMDARDKVGEPKRDSLVVILETSGGYIEVAERIAETFRHHYNRVDFVVPNYAFSAGTVLVMSGDAIHMDYYSVLGPIDPQVDRGDEQGFVPALGYLKKYDELIEKSRNNQLTTAELAYLIKRFDPAELYSYEQSKELSITLLKRWLVLYKFKDWQRTETSQTPVTPAMRQQRAEDVANQLNKTEVWHSHSRGIPMAVLVNDINLRIDDFGALDDRNTIIRQYYRLITDYMMRVQSVGVVHTYGRYQPF